MSYQIEHRHIRYFLAVAEELHFRKAAERLYISQPGLSKQIKELEEGLGLPLLYRNNRNVSLTDAGRYLQGEFSRYLEQLDRAIHHAEMIGEGKRGSLRFGYVGSAMQEVLPQLLVAYRQRYDDVTFNLTEMDNESQIESLLHRRIDIGFVRLDRVPRGLVAAPVRREYFCLVLPIDHIIDEATFASISQLKDEGFILFDPAYSPSYYEQVMQIFDSAGFAPKVSHSTIHAATIQQLVRHRFGVSIVPQSLKNPSEEGIKYIDLDQLPQRTTLSAVWNTSSTNPAMEGLLHEITLIKASQL